MKVNLFLITANELFQMKNELFHIILIRWDGSVDMYLYCLELAVMFFTSLVSTLTFDAPSLLSISK